VKKTERGYTLIELLVTLAITGIIFTAVGSALFQISTVSNAGNDLLTASHELQNAAHWFHLDGLSAWKVKGGSSLNFTFPNDLSITYSLSGSDLLRDNGESRLVLARNISAVSFTVEDRLVSMNIISSPQGRAKISEQRNYQVYLRSLQP
jgi:prepilin-type N-terminal cleavage/methylation domain-containing protein